MENKLKVLYAVFVVLLLSLSFSSVLAHEGDEEDEALESDILAESETVVNAELSGDAGVTPDSPVWGLERALENINLALTFNEAAKAKKRLEFARERLLEARIMAERNNIRALEKAKEDHQKHLLALRLRLEKLQDGNPREEIKTSEELEQELESQELAANALSVRLEIKFKGNLTEEQKARLIALIESFGNESSKVKLEIKAEKAKAKLKLRALESLTEDEADEVEEEAEFEAEVNNTSEGRGPEAVANAFIRIAEKAIEHAEEKISRMSVNVTANVTLPVNETNQTGNETNQTANQTVRHRVSVSTEVLAKAQAHLNNATALLEQAKAALADKNYSEVKRLAYMARREAHNAIIMSSGRASLNAELTAEQRLLINEELREKAKDRLEAAREHMKEEAEELRERIKEEREERKEQGEDERTEIRTRIEERKNETRVRIESRREGRADNSGEEDEDENDDEDDDEDSNTSAVSSANVAAGVEAQVITP